MMISALTTNIFVAVATTMIIGGVVGSLRYYRWHRHQSNSLTARLRQQACVVELGRMALAGAEAIELLNTAVSFVAQGLCVEYAKILKIEPEQKVLLLKAVAGWGQDLVGNFCIPLNDSHAGYTLIVREPVIVEDLTADNRFKGSGLLQSAHIKSGLSVPIAVGNEVYGVLGAHTTRYQHFTDDDINFLKAIAQILSSAIERWQREDVLRKNKEFLENNVLIRTQELVALNQQLQTELDERKRAQQELHISQERFAGIVNIADDAIISIDRNQQIILFNQGAERVFGYSAQEVLGCSLDILIPLRYVGSHRGFVQDFGGSKTVTRRMGERREIFGRRRDGREFPAEASISKLDLENETIYTVYLQDISDRKQIERMKDEFISVVSHELRTPLTSIHGSLGMLASGLITGDSEQGKRLLQIATDSTERLVRLINDILDIERIESGRVKMEKQFYNVAEIMAQAVNIMQAIADKAKINLDVEYLHIQVWVDADKIVQTLTNLLSNAIKFSDPGSTVYLRAKTTEEQQICFQVEDTGRGIPSDKIDSIFERFQQVDSSDSRKQEGTGLGLAICRSIVQQHNGKIWVESQLGEGSIFYFTLPIVPNNPDSPLSVAIAAKTDIESPFILVCDDDPDVLNEIKNLLESQKYRVVTVTNGEEAIAFALTHNPDVILLDLIMPGMSGWEVMAELKQNEKTSTIPIVICSVCSASAVNSSDEFTDWVCKPVDETSLFQSLQHALSTTPKLARVLIVEDDPSLAEIICELLSAHHIKIQLAQTGREAIRLSQEFSPDLLILDISLPEGDGFAVVEWLKQHNHLYSVPLLVYSAKDLDETERDRLRLGNTQFLTKGRVSIREFEIRVMEILQKITYRENLNHDNLNRENSNCESLNREEIRHE